MEIFGLPAHVLVVHGAVVLTPLAAASTIAFAVLPRYRYLTRWPTALLAIAATGAIWGAKLTGPSLRDTLLKQQRITQDLIATHQSRANVLALVMIAFLVLTLIGAKMLGGPTGLASGKGEVAKAEPWAELVIALGLVLISIVTLVWVILTGDAGARATWG
jgi:hypothetical protein